MDFDITFCPHCGKEIGYIANTCPECGEAIEDFYEYCPYCGEYLPHEYHCPDCHKEITADDVKSFNALSEKEKNALKEGYRIRLHEEFIKQQEREAEREKERQRLRKENQEAREKKGDIEKPSKQWSNDIADYIKSIAGESLEVSVEPTYSSLIIQVPIDKKKVIAFTIMQDNWKDRIQPFIKALPKIKEALNIYPDFQIKIK